MSYRPRAVICILVGIGLSVTIASVLAAPETVRWRPYLFGIAVSIVMAALVYLVLTLSLRRMVAKVRSANPPENQQILVAVTDDHWARLGIERSGLSGMRYAVLDAGATGIRIFVGVGEPRLLDFIPAARVREVGIARSKLGLVTRWALKIDRDSATLPTIVVTPIGPSLRSFSSEELASRIAAFLYAMGRAAI